MDLLHALGIFARAAERRNFATAARDLGVSQATVTRAIQALERHYGVELIRRSSRQMTLTAAGLRLHRGGTALLEASVGLREEVAGEDGTEPTGPLRVTAPSAFGVTIMAPLAAAFAKKHPGVTLDLLLTDRFLDLVAENIDLAVRVGAAPDSNLVQRKLAELPEVLVAAPGYLEGAPILAQPSDLGRHPFVALSILRDARQGLPLTAADGRVVTVRPRASLSFDTPLGVREALVAGAGVGRIHLYLVAQDIAAGRLVPVLPEWRCPTWTMTLVATARSRSRAAEAFAAALVEAMCRVAGLELPSL
jgi:DNA-binding transcriptional LysR family regulator